MTTQNPTQPGTFRGREIPAQAHLPATDGPGALRTQVDRAAGAWVDSPYPLATARGVRVQVRATRDGRYLAREWREADDAPCVHVSIGPWSGRSDHARYFGVSRIRTVEQERRDGARVLGGALRQAMEHLGLR